MRKNWNLLGRILKHAKWGHFHCFWGYLPAAKRKQVTTYSVPWHQRQAARLARLTHIVLPKDSHVSSVGWACVEHRAGRDALLQSPSLPPIFLFKKNYWSFIYLVGRVMGWVRRHREESPKQLFTHQITVTAEGWPTWSQEQGTPSRSPMWVAGAQPEPSSDVSHVYYVSREAKSEAKVGLDPGHFNMGCRWVSQMAA